MSPISKKVCYYILLIFCESPAFPYPVSYFGCTNFHLFICLFPGTPAALQVKWSPAGDSYAVAIGTKVVVYKLAVSLLRL